MAILNRILERFGVGHLPVEIVLNQNIVFLVGNKPQIRDGYSQIMLNQLSLRSAVLNPGIFISLDYSMENCKLCAKVVIN